MRLTFLGAAGEVTGSCYLVDTGGVKFLVECGMFQGGRAADAKNRRFAFDPRAIVFVGFQAAGTLGRRIVDGAQSVRLFGEEYAVRAKVFTIGGLSAHADRSALLGWLSHFRRPPRCRRKVMSSTCKASA